MVDSGVYLWIISNITTGKDRFKKYRGYKPILQKSGLLKTFKALHRKYHAL